MIPSLSGVLAFTGLAAAALEPRQIMHEARDLPSFVHSFDIRDSTSKPCGIISEAYEAAKTPPGKPTFLSIPPSVGIACLKSVPYDKERDLDLLDYLLRYIQFQSTVEILANPPEDYLFPGVDILYGFDSIRDKLENDGYESQYDVMTDLQSIYASAMDNHFDYAPAILNTIYFVRRELKFVSISKDGLKLPAIYMALDVDRGNHNQLTYNPSSVDSIDGVDIIEWLENDAAHNTANFQDPDAQFNSLFDSVAGKASHKAGTTTFSTFEVPDNHTITFSNGSSIVVQNEILIPYTVDFSGIANGEDFHERFEVPASTATATDEPVATSTFIEEPTQGVPEPTAQPTETPTGVPGYPEAVVRQSGNAIAGYFLDGDDYKDTAVLSILGFLPVGFDFSSSDFNMTDFVLESAAVFVEFVRECRKAGRDKLIIDLSGNGGGSVVLAQQIYRLLFPDGAFTVFDRFRANMAIEAATEADYETLVAVLISDSNSYPVNPDGKVIKNGQDWFGPEIAAGQNVTSPWQDDKSLPWDDAGVNYYNGYDPRGSYLSKPPFDPENILIVTDGICASACGILTGLLTRNHGIRTLALGGRPNYYAMQAMGGVKGTRLTFNYGILQDFATFVKVVAEDDNAISILKDAQDSLPRFENPPLLPMLGPGSGGQVNSRNGYTEDDLEGYPVHFRYEAANCKLFFTQQMTMDISECWRKASQIGWHGASCVVGSSVNEDGTIGNTTLAYDSNVRSGASPLVGPGALN